MTTLYFHSVNRSPTIAFCADCSFIATFKLLAYLKFYIKSGNTGGQYIGVMAAQVAPFGPNLC